jgi:hypothetical protein
MRIGLELGFTLPAATTGQISAIATEDVTVSALPNFA